MFVLELVAACSSSSKQLSDKSPEFKTKVSQSPDLTWAAELQSHIKTVKAPDVQAYLKSLCNFLNTSLVPRPGTVQVDLTRDQNELWQSLSLPGSVAPDHHLYFSIELIKKIRFENELVALLALESLHAQKNTWLQRFQQVQSGSPGRDWKNSMPSSRELLSASKEFHWVQDDKKIFKEAISILYKTGYDPRGLVSLIQIYQVNISYSPFDSEFLDQVLPEVRREIAIFPPLRNPIIQTNRFLKIQKRINSL